MRSMTGYGRGTCEVAGRRLVVELRSVNHRFLEIKLRLPWSDASIEAHFTQAIRARLGRGAVTASVRDEGGGAAQAVRADVALARQVYQALTEIRSALGLEEPVALSLVATQPGVLTVGEAVADPEALWRAVEPALGDALDALVAARGREGTALKADLGRPHRSADDDAAGAGRADQGCARELPQEAARTPRPRAQAGRDRRAAAGAGDGHHRRQGRRRRGADAHWRCT